MSKVISFSISDRYLDKLRTLYPSLTDNLAVKQFVTDRLDGSLDDALDDNLKTIIESSLSSTLDDVLYERLDGQLKTIIETSLDDVLDERLDAVMGKLITSLSERLSRLEERLDDSLDGRLDDMELLAKEALRLDHLDDQKLIDAIESQLEDTEIDESDYEPDSTNEPDTDAIETLPKVETANKIETVTDTVESVYTVEIADNVETDYEPVTDAIGPVTGDSSPIESVTGEAVTIGNRQGLTNAQLSEKTRVPVSTIEKWKGKMKVGEPIVSKRYPDFFKQWRLNPTDNLWYKID